MADATTGSLSVKEMKKLFFDRRALTDRVEKSKLDFLSRVGAYTRGTALNLIKSAKRKKSAPGEPPKSHSGELKRLMFFSYDEARESVVIGPASFSKATGVPGILEHGGTEDVTYRSWTPIGWWFEKEAAKKQGRPPRQWVPTFVGDKHPPGKFPNKTETQTIAPRPYMKPALDVTRGKIPQFLREASR